MVEKHDLTETIKRRINKIIIDKQFGISDELDLVTEEIYAKIMKTLSKVPKVTNNESFSKNNAEIKLSIIRSNEQRILSLTRL